MAKLASGSVKVSDSLCHVWASNVCVRGRWTEALQRPVLEKGIATPFPLLAALPFLLSQDTSWDFPEVANLKQDKEEILNEA